MCSSDLGVYQVTGGMFGTAYPESKTVIFDVANATAGTMKRRGRKKAA